MRSPFEKSLVFINVFPNFYVSHIQIHFVDVIVLIMSNTSGNFKISNPNEGPTLTSSQVAFMKLMEQENLKRVKKLELIRSRNRWTGWILGSCVLSIYAYTILTIRQEKFLDDFEEPEKIVRVKEE